MSKVFNIYEGSKQTGNFGEHRSYYKVGKSHEGTDLAKPENSPINTRFDGVVKNVGYDPNGYGNYIDVSHGFTPDGKEIVTRYAHSNKISKKVGDKVLSGDVLGLVGSTGRSSGPHLHTELIIGNEKKDPMELQSYITSMNNKGNNKMAILPKGSTNVTPEDVEQAKNDLIAGATQAYIQRSPEEEELRQQTLKAILDTLQKPVNMPKETKISDIVNAGGINDRLGAFSDYLKSAEAQRNLGSLFGNSKYNPRTGMYESYGEKLGREAEARLRADQQQAIEQQKTQNALAGNAFRAINEVDAEQLRNDREIARLNQQNDQFLKTIETNKEIATARAAKEKEEDDYKKSQDKINNNLKERKMRLEEDEFDYKKNHPNSETPSFSNVTTARKEFSSLPAIKNYAEIKRQYSNVKAVMDKYSKIKGNIKYNANDQTLITTFNKILDPTSVVRESEFARTAAGQGILDKIQGAAEKITKGGSGLSQSERQEVFKAIETMYKEQEKEAARLTKEYSNLATRYNIDPRDVVGGSGVYIQQPQKASKEQVIQILRSKGLSDARINQYLKNKGY